MSNQTDENKPKLSNEQKQKMKKYAVFCLMGIICAGCMWLIFAPSAEDKAKEAQTVGFNADIPLPKEEGLIGDKRDAYEQEQIKQKQAERMRSLEDFSAIMGGETTTPSNDLVLLDDEPKAVKISSGGGTKSNSGSSIQNSAKAYQDINRTLGNFYETPKNDPEKEKLQQELNELRERLDEQERQKNAVDEQMAIMERSYQVASKYLPLNTANSSGTVFPGTPATVPEPANNGSGNDTGNSNVSGKMKVVPVSQFVEQTVSALPQEMSGKEVMQALAQPRNMGFFTATAELSKEWKNTIPACIHADQTLMDGESVRLRLLESMRAGKMLVRENTLLSGLAKIQGERLQITVTSMEYNGNIIPVEMSVYDTDGQRGIFIPDTKTVNAAKEIAANMGTNAGTSISLSSDAGEQLAADMGRSVIQGVSQFFSRKMREVKVNLKAGYRVFLLPEGNINNSQFASK